MNARLFIAFLAIASCGTRGLAHAFLQHADPGAGTTLRAPPQRVALSFTEKLEPGAAVIAGSSIVVPIRSLMPGSYRVSWHAVSVDTHRTEGAYSFMVKP